MLREKEQDDVCGVECLRYIEPRLAEAMLNEPCESAAPWNNKEAAPRDLLLYNRRAGEARGRRSPTPAHCGRQGRHHAIRFVATSPLRVVQHTSTQVVCCVHSGRSADVPAHPAFSLVQTRRQLDANAGASIQTASSQRAECPVFRAASTAGGPWRVYLSGSDLRNG